MKLSEFSEGRIFIDTNIFAYHHLDHPKYGDNSTEFLERVESGEINAITSIIVLDEVIFVLLREKGKELMGTDKTWKVLENLKKDFSFYKECFEVVDIFIEYIKYMGNQLKIVGFSPPSFFNSIKYCHDYSLFPRDAQIVAILENEAIKDIATNDDDFKRVEFLRVWEP